MSKRASYQQVAEYIIDQWLDRGVPLTELIEAFLRADERATYENAALLAVECGANDVAAKIRAMKPREHMFKPGTGSVKNVPGWKP